MNAIVTDQAGVIDQADSVRHKIKLMRGNINSVSTIILLNCLGSLKIVILLF